MHSKYRIGFGSSLSRVVSVFDEIKTVGNQRFGFRQTRTQRERTMIQYTLELNTIQFLKRVPHFTPFEVDRGGDPPLAKPRKHWYTPTTTIKIRARATICYLT